MNSAAGFRKFEDRKSEETAQWVKLARKLCAQEILDHISAHGTAGLVNKITSILDEK